MAKGNAASTKNVHIVSCGVPGVDRVRALEAYGTCARYMKEHAGGVPSEPHTYP